MYYRVDTAAVRHCGSEMIDIAKEMNAITDEISDVSRCLRGMGSPSMFLLSIRINLQRQKICRERSNAARMGAHLEEIAGMYERAEAENAQNCGKGEALNRTEPRNRDVSDLSDEEKDRIIQEFITAHPELDERLNGFLRTGDRYLKEEDIRNIKYLVYTASAPFRDIYLNSLNGYSINKKRTKDGAYYTEGTCYYTYPDSFSTDPRGGYTTFFHENGHAIDHMSNVCDGSDGWDTSGFRIFSNEMNREVSLQDTIEYDVFYNAANPHSIYSIGTEKLRAGGASAGGNLDNVITAFKSGSSRGLSKEDRILYNAIKNEFKRQTSVSSSARFEAVSDVYGGMSGNELRNGYGHDKSYWKNDPTNVVKELWAEYFSYNMAGDGENLTYLREFFPESYGVLEQYAHTLAEK